MNNLKTSFPLPSDADSDAELVALALAGNDLAFAQIMRRPQPPAFSHGPQHSQK